jgi:hypothetical protein
MNSVGSPYAQGAVLFSQDLNVESFGDTRMLQFASLFNKFVFRKLIMHYSPIMGTATGSSGAAPSANFIGFFLEDPDSSLNPSGGQPNIKIANATPGFSEFPCWTPSATFLKANKNETYWVQNTGTEARTQSQGTFYFMAGNTVTVNSGGFDYGNIYFEYEIELWDPTLGSAYFGDAMVSGSKVIPMASNITAANAYNSLSVNQGSAANQFSINPLNGTMIFPAKIADYLVTLKASNLNTSGSCFGNSVSAPVSPYILSGTGTLDMLANSQGTGTLGPLINFWVSTTSRIVPLILQLPNLYNASSSSAITTLISIVTSSAIPGFFSRSGLTQERTVEAKKLPGENYKRLSAQLENIKPSLSSEKISVSSPHLTRIKEKYREEDEE